MLSTVAGRAHRPALQAARILRLRSVQAARLTTTSETQTRHAWLFLSSVFPVRFASWDLRYLFGQFRQEQVLGQIRSILSEVDTHGFKFTSLEPYDKDGGVYVKFDYTQDRPEDVLPDIEAAIQRHFKEKGGVPSSSVRFAIAEGSAWVVKGKPWREDMVRWPTYLLRVVFDGPDLNEETIYETFRPFGRIYTITPPAPVPNSPYRGSTIVFHRVSSAIAARNITHGLVLDKTRIRTFYDTPVNTHAIRDWITSHPRIFIPVLIFVFGTITYTIFDPIRTFTVEAKMSDWLDYREFMVYKWIRRNTVDRFSFLSSPQTEEEADTSWQQRQDVRDALENYLADVPNSVAFLHGPQGSGKTRMINKLLSDKKRATLIIDCAELARARSDSHLITILARQLGYWPSFPFLNNLNSLIDLTTKGLIGQPAGLSATAPEQIKQMLDVVVSALQKIAVRNTKSSSNDSGSRAGKERTLRPLEQRPSSSPSNNEKPQRSWWESARALWYDPRQSVVSGIGVISELATGEEPSTEKDANGTPAPTPTPNDGNSNGNGKTNEETEAIAALPIVVIQNYAMPGSNDEIMDVFARWAAAVTENQLAHVVVVSDNRENSKKIAKALPSKPLNMIALDDADSTTALQFVKHRLNEAGIQSDLSPEQTAYIERLGGRASDLASLIHKVRSGQSVEEAVEDIINRGVSELRKNAFGDDADDAKSLAWTREQAWAVLKALSKTSEVPYHDVLVNFPFKGDESALRYMERAELISIGMFDGRPSVIRPGKPVYRYVFEKLVNDPIFRATQEIAFNLKLIDIANTTVQSSEEELTRLYGVAKMDNKGWLAETATQRRARYVVRKMHEAQLQLEKLESENTELKKVLKSA